ncbi:SGNH/GDSL hydrolase family protein [Parafrigoribacterium mesophilum]|uniref:SGNH/GDSL hydrolase family protein n=1 Tax=Parafrigoribacterium mesophilum TaxID=433646 RepID=UPI0031FCAF2B
MFQRYVAIGDSFTEGVGDDLPDGQVRGWADLVAVGLAQASAAPVSYANLAIRGKLLGPIVREQLDPALALKPDLLTVSGGGNDLMRPRVEIGYIIDLLQQVVDRAQRRGAHVVLVSGGNPSRHLPMGALMQRRGDALATQWYSAFTRDDITLVDNWSDAELMQARFWSRDKLHLNALGHTKVATRVLGALGVPAPQEWADAAGRAPGAQRVQGTVAYYREFVLPWIGRRLTGRSSGDGRPPKRPELEPVERP